MKALSEPIEGKRTEVQFLVLAGKFEMDTYRVAKAQLAKWTEAWNLNQKLRKSMLKAFLFAAAILATSIFCPAQAGSNERGALIGWQVHQPTRFIVSAVLRKNGTTGVIKPIHGIVTAETNESAIAIFGKTAAAKYADYTLIATLASQVPATGTCENTI